MKKYKHLSEDERNRIVVLINRGISIRDIARVMERNPGTISRELKRNRGKQLYRAHIAHKHAMTRHRTAHKRQRLKSYALRIEVEKLVMNRWSPELIAGRLRQCPQLPTISHEAIYQWIYSDSPHLIDYLTRSHPARWPKGKSKNRRCHCVIPDRVSITQRPASINNRRQPGHWEADLVIGRGHSALQVIAERTSRLTKLLKIPNKTATVSRSAIESILRNFPVDMRRSITYDNGSENFEHSKLNDMLGTVSYFCQPYHAWEKATVENTNSLIRRFFPKKTNFDIISDVDIKKVEA